MTNEMDQLEKVLSAQRRLEILRLLEKAPGYAGNGAVLAGWLDVYALGGMWSSILAEFQQLERLLAVVLTRHDDEPVHLVVRLTERGLDHVQRRTILDDVARPGP